MTKNVLIRNIDEKTLDQLKRKAACNNRSLQEELKSLLERYAGPDPEEVKKRIRGIFDSFNEEGKRFPDSTKDIREIREKRENR